jgi:hypothetical protein
MRRSWLLKAALRMRIVAAEFNRKEQNKMSWSYWPRSPPSFPQDRQLHREEKKNDEINQRILEIEIA